jgi:hypothetical protein
MQDEKVIHVIYATYRELVEVGVGRGALAAQDAPRVLAPVAHVGLSKSKEGNKQCGHNGAQAALGGLSNQGLHASCVDKDTKALLGNS